jgi:hypothetical protein
MPAKPQMKPFSTRLPDDVREALQAKALALGLTESDLGRMILIERLMVSQSPPLGDEFRSLAALIIAALSDSIDLDQARELVSQHVSPLTPVTV